MGKRILSFPSVTTSAFADSANLTDGGYMCALSNASTTQRTAISEVYCGGLAPSASSPVIPILSLAHVLAATVGATTTFDAAVDPGMAALAAPVVVGNFFTTKPQSGVNHKITLPFNAFGGLSKWQCPVGVGAEIIMAGNAVDIGAATFAMFTGSTASTLVGGYVVYETQ